MRYQTSSAAAILAAAIPAVLAQTSTSCNPTEKSCPADTGLDASTYTADFTKGSSANASWSVAAYTTLTYDSSNGAVFTISKEGEAPTIQTDFYFLFGRAEVTMRSAPGTGIVSSIVLLSDDLDEIDWEFLGSSNNKVETNFFGKDNTTAYDRAVYYPVDSPETEFHTYAVDWTSERIEWIVDGTTVRTLSKDDPLTVGGKNYPQTPMQLKLGNWCGGCSGDGEGTIEWAGGNATFDGTPYNMYVRSVTITNYNPASSYKYGDKSGNWESIQIIKDGTTASASSATDVPTVSSGSATKGNATASTSAPTAAATVVGIEQQTNAVVSKTVTGSSYSANTASASALNADNTLATSSVDATATSTAGPSSSGSATSSSGPSMQTGTGTSEASIMGITTVGSLLSAALAFWML